MAPLAAPYPYRDAAVGTAGLSTWLVPGGVSFAEAIGEACRAAAATIALAESCTGGLIASQITDVPGASGYLDRSWVTYSNRAKVEELGVPADLIDAHGAVSAPVARHMATGARMAAGVDAAVAVTGVAGPGGGSAEKPVGRVYLAVATSDSGVVVRATFRNRSREEFKLTTAALAERMLLGGVRQTLDADRSLLGRFDGVDHVDRFDCGPSREPSCG